MYTLYICVIFICDLRIIHMHIIHMCDLYMWSLYVWSLYVYICVIFICTYIFVNMYVRRVHLYTRCNTWYNTSSSAWCNTSSSYWIWSWCIASYCNDSKHTYIYGENTGFVQYVMQHMMRMFYFCRIHMYIFVCSLYTYICIHIFIMMNKPYEHTHQIFFRFRSLSLSLSCTRTHSLSLSRSLSRGFSLSHTHSLSRTLSLTHSLPFLWGVLNLTYRICCVLSVVWLWLVRSIKLYVSFAKEPYKRDNILQKRQIIQSILLTVATPYRAILYAVSRMWMLASLVEKHMGWLRLVGSLKL